MSDTSRSVGPKATAAELLSNGSEHRDGRSFAEERTELTLDAGLAARLSDLSARESVPLWAIMVTGWVLLLARWTAREEVVLSLGASKGTPPPQSSVTDPSTLTLTVSLAKDRALRELLPIAASTLSRAAALSNGSLCCALDAGSLSLSLHASPRCMTATFESADHQFDRKTLERMADAWAVLLDSLDTHLDQPVHRLPILTAEERKRVLFEYNETAKVVPARELIHELFEDQVLRSSDAIAVIDGERSVTFAELNARANRLARHLRSLGVGPEQIVGLCMERSTEVVVGILGALKAGGAYLPLDPAYPIERLTWMVDDARPKVIVTQERHKGVLASQQGAIIVIDGDWHRIEQYEGSNLDTAHLDASGLAYVIYTSGSTGVPKGAMNDHRGMVSRIWAHREIEALSDVDVCCHKTSISFVDAVFEVLGALCNGRPLVIVPSAAVSDTRIMASIIAERGVTQLVTVPSLARAMLESREVMRKLAGLRCWTLSGEPIAADLLRRLQRELPRCEFLSLYGASEVSSDAAFYKTNGSFAEQRVPVGQPVPGVHLYVLDSHGEPVPTGVAGEIHVAGVGVGRGYIKRPDLTSQRFVADPFRPGSGARMYRTGDLGRWRPDGLLECLGRSDHQLKIRGFRIEPGEVEARLRSHVAVADAVVVAQEDARGEKALVAYVILRDARLTLDVLREHLKRTLPDYMVPAALVVMDALPRTPNGKLDRRALPLPGPDAYAKREYVAPEGEIEGTLARVWKEVLGVDQVGRHDNFFELGGHSLLLVQVLERMRAAGLAAEVSSIYASRSLAELSAVVAVNGGETIEEARHTLDGVGAVRPGMFPLVNLNAEQFERVTQCVPGGTENIQDIYPLTPLQEGMLFHQLLEGEGGNTYVEVTLLSVTSRQELENLIAALQGVIDRHDILRTAVLWEGLPQPIQVVLRDATMPVEQVALTGLRDREEQIAEWIKPANQKMDLRNAPLIRLQIAPDGSSGRWYALLQLHHMVDDERSVKILVEEIVAHLERRETELPPAVAYRDYVVQALAHARSHDAEAFFRSKLRGIDEPTAPFGILDVHGDGTRIEEARGRLEPELVRKLRSQVRRLNVSVATLFHAAWALVVARTTVRDDVVFGSILLGRLQGTAGAKQMVGMFVNTLPIRLRLNDVTSVQLVLDVHRELAELLDYEQASLAVAQRCSDISGSAPLFTAVLNFRHTVVEAEAEWARASGVRLLKNQYRTNYPVTVSIDDLGETIGLLAQTDRRIDAARMVGYLATAVRSLLDVLERDPKTPALMVSVIPRQESGQIAAFSAASDRYPIGKLIHTLFEEQVERRPDAIAVSHDGSHLSYDQINRRANQLARYLRARGVVANQRVGLCIERSVDLIVGVLAILKAGGAYVPLDPAYPAERLFYTLDDAMPAVVLIQERLRAGTAGFHGDVVAIDSQWDEIARAEHGDRNLEIGDAHPQNAAYVIYTSGSTGNPKGVVVEHRNVTRLFAATRKWFNFSDGDTWTLFHSIAFDFSVWEIWGALFYGGRLVVVPHHIARAAHDFYRLLCAEGVTVLNQTPSAFAQLIDSQAENAELRHSLRLVIFGGEALEPRMLRPWVERNGAERPHLVNMYGITETTVHVTYRPLTEDEIASESASLIGRPIPDLSVHILDVHRQPVPIGVIGELYVGGAGVARGYLNRPRLTSERFLRDPFASESDARLYKTGDLGRWRPDGSIEYLGRNDHQVKIRGFRIELGEIQAQLQQHPYVKDAVVLAREDAPGEKRLVAYIVGNSRQSREARIASSATVSAEVVDQWRQVYEETYGGEELAPSFVGWNSSYTGQPIPENQMREWLTCTVERIEALKPRRLLEIGCGVGLLLEHLAPRCEAYWGLDFSEAAVRRLQRWLAGREGLKNVELRRRAAHELGDLPSGSFDTVVINSVVQYFPDIEYLLAVVQEALRVLGPGGRIFIGDVRHLGLLQAFHSAVQLGKAAATVSASQLRGRVGRAVSQEKELVIDPEFFEALPGTVPGVGSVDVQLKRGEAANELTRYRYDVVIHKDESRCVNADCDRLQWRRDVGSLAELENLLDTAKSAAVRLEGVPNSRVMREAAACRLIAESDAHVEASTLRRRVDEGRQEDIEPQVMWDLGERYGYDVRVGWSSGDSPELLDVQFVNRALADQVRWLRRQPAKANPASAYANDPLESSFRQQLIPQLREYLKSRVPEHMIPAAWVVLKQLPLTNNGKLDRQALPAPQTRPEEIGEYVAPRTDLERALAEIWTQVLRVDQVGVQDNFFELGGHSLVATRVIAHINHLLDMEVPIRLLFEKPTVEALGASIVERIAAEASAEVV